MNTIRIKTKKPVLIDPSSNLSSVVYLEIRSKVHHFLDDRFEFGIRYYYLLNDDESDAVTQVNVPYKPMGTTKTKEEINYVASKITPQGETYTDIERSYTLAGAFAIVHAASAENWGLTAEDWEVA